MAGYIKLYRKSRDHKFWRIKRVFSWWEAWEDLLMEAAWEDHKIAVQGRVIDVRRGEVPHSQRTLAARWSWPKTNVNRFTDLLISDQKMDRRSDHGIKLLVIVNYDTYQSCNNKMDQQRTSNGPVMDQQPDRQPDQQMDHGIKLLGIVDYDTYKDCNNKPDQQTDRQPDQQPDRTEEVKEEVKKETTARASAHTHIVSSCSKFENAMSMTAPTLKKIWTDVVGTPIPGPANRSFEDWARKVDAGELTIDKFRDAVELSQRDGEWCKGKSVGVVLGKLDEYMQRKSQRKSFNNSPVEQW